MFENIRDTLQKKIKKDSIENEVEEENTRISRDYFSPFSSVISVYNSRIRIYKSTIGVLFFSLITVFVIEEFRIHKALKSVLNKEWIVIPGATNFQKVRPGEISDDVLFGFTDWFVKQLGTFDYQDVELQYNELEKYMAPEMRVKFSVENKAKIDKYKKFSVVQYIQFSKPDKIFQKVDNNGEIYYEVTYNGVINRFTNDEKLKPISEILTLKFTTSSLENTNRKWFFEVQDIQRKFDDLDKVSLNSSNVVSSN